MHTHIKFLGIFVVSVAALRADLVAHWTLDEGSGAIAADSTANGLTGTIAGGASWTTDDLPPVPSGTTAALVMDGVDDQIDIVGYKGITGTGDRTIAAWIKTGINSTAQNKAIASWGLNEGTRKWTFRIQNGNGTAGAIRIEANGGFFVGNTAVTDTEWHHVAVTWANDGTPDIRDAKLYVDGVLDAEFGSLDVPPSASQSVAIDTAEGADVRIGDNFQATHNWDGSMDDVRIYDEALDAEAIASLALGIPIVADFEASEEIVSSGDPVILSWTSDPTNSALEIDNGVGNVLGTDMVTVNPTADTTYTITGARDGETVEREVTVLVEKAPVVNSFVLTGADTILEGQSTTVTWDVFGETTVSINGTDVTDEDLVVLAPTETTTYVLTATNEFGSTTSEIVVTVLDENAPYLSWTADDLEDGLLDQWDPAINVTGNNGITFLNTTGGTVESGTSNFIGVSQWVNSPGFNMSSNPNDSWQDGLGDAVTKQDVTWEMVFRPGDFTGTHVLFNTGGNGDGTAIVLTDAVLDFRFQDANSDAQRLILSSDLSALGDADEFYHIVATADVGAGISGIGSLYVNGELVAGPTTSTGIISDWDGGDLAEFGKGSNIPTSTAFPFEPFNGDIALFNYYQNKILDESRITALYEAISGASADLTITSIEYNPATDQLTLTFNSAPGRFYALESSDDLLVWSEIDDSIPSAGDETTVVLEGIDPSDPENAKVFFRILPGLE